MKEFICEIRFDDARYLGSEEDGVYFDAAEGPDGWYASAVVDCNSTHFTDTLLADEGPYPSEAAALRGAENVALDWCITNEVDFDPKDLLLQERQAVEALLLKGINLHKQAEQDDALTDEAEHVTAQGLQAARKEGWDWEKDPDLVRYCGRATALEAVEATLAAYKAHKKQK